MSSDKRNYKIHPLVVKLLVIAVSVVSLLVLPLLHDSINTGIESVSYSVAGELRPDTSIVIIHISENDIQALGGYPLKRNMYALLLNKLRLLGVKKTGIEIVFNADNTSGGVYDELLLKELNKSSNVILGAAPVNVTQQKNQFTAEGVVLPSLGQTAPLKTGHINYFEEPDPAIPLTVNVKGDALYAFGPSLDDSIIRTAPQILVVNPVCSWKKFRNYELLEFLSLSEHNAPELLALKDKYIFVGVSDPNIAKKVPALFEKEIPAIAFHAFALENLLQKRYITNTSFTLSGVIFFFAMLALVLSIEYFRFRYRKSAYLVSVVIVFFIDIALHFTTTSQLDYALYFFPILALLVVQIIIDFRNQGMSIELLRGEAALIKSLYEKKESELKRIEKEFDATGGDTLLEKINGLKDEIRKLRSKEDNEKIVDAAEISDELKSFNGIVYTSKVMAGIVDIVKKIAMSNETALLIGESGTGKELVARAIHNESSRRNNNFVAVNCGALSEHLLESELFGHAKGAFTGAVAEKIGRFELADEGTIFLDEIGEISENFQVKLLRVLQLGEFERVGSTSTIKVNIRVVAATNKDLTQMVAEGKFREDLYYRLNVLKIKLPALRERKDDIPALVKYFIERDSSGLGISVAVLDALTGYEWKGNIRELESVIKRALVFTKALNKRTIQITDLPEELTKGLQFEYEDIVLEALRTKKFSHSSFTETAKELSASRTLISEHFRGYAFKMYVLTEYNLDKTVFAIVDGNDPEATDKVRTKLKTLISNVEDEARSTGLIEFEPVREQLAVKYRNLPKKFHSYLDDIIRRAIEPGDYIPMRDKTVIME